MLLIKEIIIFSFLAYIIIFSTKKLARVGEALTILTPFSGGIIGFTLMAAITSMPEVSMSLSALLVIKDANLAGGDLFGSNLFNLTILAGIEVFISKGKFISSLGKYSKKIIASQLVFTMIPFVAIMIVSDSVFLRLSPFSWLLIILYILAIKFFHFEEQANEDQKTDMTLKGALLRFLLLAVVIITASVLITRSCDHISELTGLGNSFLGALLLATVSSLPEIALSVSLVSIGATPMAIGNILGSNFFNMTIFSWTDLAIKDSLYPMLHSIHAIPVMFMTLTSIILFNVAGRSKKTALISSYIILFIYCSAMYVLFLYSKQIA